MIALICIFLLIGLGTCIEENSSSALSNDILHLRPMSVNETVDPGINLNPPPYSNLINTGNYYFEKGNFLDALHCYNKAAALDEERPDAWRNKAAAFGEIQLYPEAYAAIIKYLEIVPDDLEAQNFKDYVLEQITK
jgi:tetratricopeptide (TPR) repeat protein